MTDAIALSNDALDKAIEADVRQLEGAVKKAVETAWRLGQRLTLRRERTKHGAWEPYLRKVGITERSARVYMTMARQIGSAADLAPSIRATLTDIGETTKANREAERRAFDDRLAIRLEGCTGDPVEYLQAMLDAKNKTHTAHMAELRKLKQRTAAAERKFQDIGKALRAATARNADTMIDDVLARFFSVKRKAAA